MYMCCICCTTTEIYSTCAALAAGYKRVHGEHKLPDGRYVIDPDGINIGVHPFQVYCDFPKTILLPTGTNFPLLLQYNSIHFTVYNSIQITSGLRRSNIYHLDILSRSIYIYTKTLFIKLNFY